ncbi:MAG: RidA family protein [Dehalococcoidia bacterium]|nr:RidA family protein [Dehalococcoidia bacterium]
MPKEIIAPPDVVPARGYSHAIKAGNTVYVAGQVAWDINGNLVGKGDFEAQARLALENLKRVLAAAGAQMTDVVQLNYYIRNLEDVAKMRNPYREYFGKYFPCQTLTVISSLADPDLLIEIQAIAVID